LLGTFKNTGTSKGSGPIAIVDPRIASLYFLLELHCHF